MAVPAVIIAVVLLSPTTALQVSPNSACSSLCMDSLTSDASDPNASNTYGSDVVCKDSDYAISSIGYKFETCLNCLQGSSASSSKENDQQWYFCKSPENNLPKTLLRLALKTIFDMLLTTASLELQIPPIRSRRNAHPIRSAVISTPPSLIVWGPHQLLTSTPIAHPTITHSWGLAWTFVGTASSSTTRPHILPIVCRE